jgi:hypothetical protein
MSEKNPTDRNLKWKKRKGTANKDQAHKKAKKYIPEIYRTLRVNVPTAMLTIL